MYMANRKQSIFFVRQYGNNAMLLETAYFTSKPILLTQYIDIKSQK